MQLRMRLRMRFIMGCLAMLIVAGAASRASADEGNVDLSTLPQRETVQLTIYNGQDLTLVRETRVLTFREGGNPLQFSWANTLIDPSSVDIRFLTHADALGVLDTTFPHDKPQMLYWTIASAMAGQAVVEISYFTSGITWSADYVCTANPGETMLGLEGFVRVTNESGEDYADAEVRLVVGEINLVEMIEELARRGIVEESEVEAYKNTPRFAAVRKETAKALGAGLRAAYGRQDKRKQIVKEGLSEYFIYSIPGAETIPNGWSKRLVLFEGTRVPIDIAYRYREVEYGQHLVRLFIIRNDVASSLGTTPLPDGDIRVYRENGREGLSFLATHRTGYVPIGQRIEINLGRDPLVTLERRRTRTWRDNFWFADHRSNEPLSPDGRRAIRPDAAVAGWDDHHRWVERIRNFRGNTVAVEVRRVFEGDVVVRARGDVELHDYRTPQFTLDVGGHGRGRIEYEVTRRSGVNEKQQRVTLE